jgi:hypothetical protein
MSGQKYTQFRGICQGKGEIIEIRIRAFLEKRTDYEKNHIFDLTLVIEAGIINFWHYPH